MPVSFQFFNSKKEPIPIRDLQQVCMDLSKKEGRTINIVYTIVTYWPILYKDTDALFEGIGKTDSYIREIYEELQEKVDLASWTCLSWR